MTSSSKPSSLGSVLVIGGCGFLGKHITSLLSSAGNTTKISVLDLSTTRNRLPEDANVHYHDGDITSPASLTSIFEAAQPDVVIHTASAVLLASPATHQRVNVEGTRNLLHAASECSSVKAFVYTSSASVVSDNVNDLINADERWPVVPPKLQTEIYTETKAEAETLVLSANRTLRSTLLTVSLRPAAIFGEGDAQFIPNLVAALDRKRTNVQIGSNDNLFDVTYVGNAAHAHLLAAAALLQTAAKAPTVPLDTERVDGEVFFVTNGTPVYFWDFARTVWKAAGDETEPARDVWVLSKEVGLALASVIEWVMWALGKEPSLKRKQVRYSCMTRYYSIEKAHSRLGYVPKVGVQEGVERAVRWWREEGSKRGDREKEK
ncbi:MAG: erg26, C-3 sterol dehydrogenase [Piccolia ochrophora]|nr:MAG: erg26, C-3 sterol dehydrogenase [Piccolia ochrophora]